MIPSYEVPRGLRVTETEVGVGAGSGAGVGVSVWGAELRFGTVRKFWGWMWWAAT